MCRALEVTRSGCYAWLREPVSNRAQDDTRLLRLIRASFTANLGIYGSPRVFLNLREAGETGSKHHVARLMRVNKIRAIHGYRTRHYSASKPSVLIPNLAKRNFEVSRPNKVWVTANQTKICRAPSEMVRKASTLPFHILPPLGDHYGSVRSYTSCHRRYRSWQSNPIWIR
jgi:transposase InsO family protein